MGTVSSFAAFKEKTQVAAAVPKPQQSAVEDPLIEEFDEFALYGVFHAISSCAQKGDIKNADRMYNYIKGMGFPQWVELPSDMEKLFYETDAPLAMFGPEK